jgi:PIN domain nuclease of toxin-antitoxin system
VKLLLDTCTFLWVALDEPRLSATAAAAFSDPENDLYLSSVSAWEISIKHASGRLPLPKPPDQLIPTLRRDHGIEPLPLDEESALQLVRLPALHRDPFDRMLACQALVGGLVILTPDRLLTQYPIRSIW